MTLTHKQGTRLTETIGMFLINILIFLLSKIFVEISIWECILYSVVNAIWIPVLLLPNIKRIQIWLNSKKRSYTLNPLYEYTSEFERRQKEVQLEIECEKKNLDELRQIYKDDWKLFRKHLERNKIKHLYHFTDKKNIKSIIETGCLFSWNYCNQNNIKIERPGGDELSRKLDVKKGLENYVRLSFTPDHPMMYSAIKTGRIEEPVILEIKIESIFLKDTLFSDQNATRKDANIGDNFSDFEKIRFDLLYATDYLNTEQENKPYFQAEVLVKEKVFISQMNVIQKFKTMYA